MAEREYPALPVPQAGGRVIASPFQFYTTGEEHLRLETWCSTSNVTLALHYRFLPARGGIIANAENHATDATRTRRRTDVKLGNGAILNVGVAVDSGSVSIGQCFVRLQLIRGFGGATVVMGTLLQGYVASGADLAWPGSPIERPTEGAGIVRIVAGSAPAFGTEISESVPTGATWELLAVYARLTTEAVVWPRIPHLWLLSVYGNVLRTGVYPEIPGSTAAYISWFPGAVYQAAHDPYAVHGPLPPRLVVPAATQITTVTSGFHGGDIYDQVRLIVREWLTAA